jgi:hypothetical protein
MCCRTSRMRRLAVPTERTRTISGSEPRKDVEVTAHAEFVVTDIVKGLPRW